MRSTVHRGSSASFSPRIVSRLPSHPLQRRGSDYSLCAFPQLPACPLSNGASVSRVSQDNEAGLSNKHADQRYWLLLAAFVSAGGRGDLKGEAM